MVVPHTYPIAFVPSELRDADEHRNTRDYLKVRTQIMNGGVKSGGRNRVGVPSLSAPLIPFGCSVQSMDRKEVPFSVLLELRNFNVHACENT